MLYLNIIYIARLGHKSDKRNANVRLGVKIFQQRPTQHFYGILLKICVEIVVYFTVTGIMAFEKTCGYMTTNEVHNFARDNIMVLKIQGARLEVTLHTLGLIPPPFFIIGTCYFADGMM